MSTSPRPESSDPEPSSPDAPSAPSSASEAAASREEPGKGGSPLRLAILVILLLIFGGALAYDRLVARPASEKAEQELTALVEARNNSAGQIEREEVLELVGTKPVHENVEGSQFKMDVFHWRAGAPWRSYQLYVVYTGTGEQLFYHTHFLNQEPPDELRPGYQPESPESAGPPGELMETPGASSSGGERPGEEPGVGRPEGGPGPSTELPPDAEDADEQQPPMPEIEDR